MVGDTDSGGAGGFYEQNSGVPQGMGHKPNTQPGSSSFGNASQGLHGLDSWSGFSFGGYPGYCFQPGAGPGRLAFLAFSVFRLDDLG